jgi:hypothetical protein
MLQHEENHGLLYTINLGNHFKCTYLNTSNVNVNENMVLSLLHNASSSSVIM